MLLMRIWFWTKYQLNALIYTFCVGVEKARIAQLVTLVKNVTSTHDPSLLTSRCSMQLFMWVVLDVLSNSSIPLCKSFLS